MLKSEEIILELISVALGSAEVINVSSNTNWKEVVDIASTQGVLGLCFDGIEKVPSNQRPDKNILFQWFGHCVQQTELFRKNWSAACSLASLLEKNSIEAIVLKGGSIAKYYPTPEHRYSCDLDLFVVGDDWERACEILEAKGISLEREVYKEVEFTYDGVNVELHRYITPVRGNKTLLRFERYLREVLKDNPKRYFEGTRLLCPPLLFTVMLYIEHALGDLLHGKLTLKHVVDWMVLRKQEIDRNVVEERCMEFGFHRFLMLMDALADVMEGKVKMASLPSSHREVMESFFVIQSSVNKEKNSWFARRVSLFFDIIRNRRYYSRFGYCSMERFLLTAVWAHFFGKEVSIKG